MKLILSGLLVIFTTSVSATLCPATCPTECAFQATKDNIQAIYPLIKRLDENVNTIFCDCCDSVKAALGRQAIYTNSINVLAGFASQSIKIVTKAMDKSESPQLPQLELSKAALQIPDRCSGSPPVCNCECAKIIIAEIKALTDKAWRTLSKRCLSEQECADRITTFERYQPNLSILLSTLENNTAPCGECQV